MITIPASAQPILDAINNAVNFKLLQNEFIKRFLRMYVFKDL